MGLNDVRGRVPVETGLWTCFTTVPSQHECKKNLTIRQRSLPAVPSLWRVVQLHIQSHSDVVVSCNLWHVNGTTLDKYNIVGNSCQAHRVGYLKKILKRRHTRPCALRSEVAYAGRGTMLESEHFSSLHKRAGDQAVHVDTTGGRGCIKFHIADIRPCLSPLLPKDEARYRHTKLPSRK